MPIVLHRLDQRAAGTNSPDASGWSEIKADWYGKVLPAALRYRLEYGLSGGKPLLTARFELPIPSSTRSDAAASGSFVEGLWNFDVAELFLLNPATGNYQEFNLSPYGEWWSCCFKGYRSGRRPQPQLPVQAAARRTAAGWCGELAVPIAGLFAGVEIESAKIHLAAILGPGADRRYLSSKPSPGIDPDFHRPDTFQPVEIAE